MSPLASAVLLSLTTTSLSVGWGRGHGVVRPWAIAQLPAWQQDLLAPVVGGLTHDYLALQDAFAGGQHPELEPYCSPPDVKVSLHDICPPDPATRAMVWYLQQLDAHLDAGQLDEAAKYLGVLCHWCEDPASPSAHCLAPLGITETQLRQLLPPPRDKQQWHYTYGYSGIADRGSYQIEAPAYTPQLLGATLAEAALHLYHRQLGLAREARGIMVPMLQNELYSDGVQADRLRGEQAHRNGMLIADLLHTALCLAQDRVDPAAAAVLDGYDLTRLEPAPLAGKADMPYAWTPYLIDASFTAKREIHPLQLVGREEIEHGLGLGSSSSISYALAPQGVYRKLTATIGLHPDSTAGGAVRFIVADGTTELYRSDELRSGEPGREVEVELPADHPFILRLAVEPVEGSVAAANLAVVAEPKLWR